VGFKTKPEILKINVILIKQNMASPIVDVYVKLPTGRTSVLKLLPTDCVRNINEQIGNEEGIPSTRIRMKYQGKFLDKSKTIGYLGIRPETILKADVRISNI
jgi:hypothetical protein